jgi:hypothetical protein
MRCRIVDGSKKSRSGAKITLTISRQKNKKWDGDQHSEEN